MLILPLGPMNTCRFGTRKLYWRSTLGETMSTYTTSQAAIFEPATSYGRIFSVWHADVAPQLEIEYLARVEAVIRHWTEVDDTVFQAVREQQDSQTLED